MQSSKSGKNKIKNIKEKKGLSYPLLKLHYEIKKLMDWLFFHGSPTKKSDRITFIIENTFLMVFIFFFLFNVILYGRIGNLYKEGSGYRLDWVFGNLDSMIPFIPEAAIFYVCFFFTSAFLTLIYFTFIDAEKGLALSWSLVTINIIAIAVYVIFPVSTYWYRMELLSAPITGNHWAQLMYDYYEKDTSFNCFPSLHASVTTLIAYFWYRYACLKKTSVTIIIAMASIFIAIGVLFSTLLVKQHYIADNLAGMTLAIVTGKFMIAGMWIQYDKLQLKPGKTDDFN